MVPSRGTVMVRGASARGAARVTVNTHDAASVVPPTAATSRDVPTELPMTVKPKVSTDTPDTGVENVTVKLCTRPATFVPFTPSLDEITGSGGAYTATNPITDAAFGGTMLPACSAKGPSVMFAGVTGRDVTSRVRVHWVVGWLPTAATAKGNADMPPRSRLKSAADTPATGTVNVAVITRVLACVVDPDVKPSAVKDGTGGV